MMVLIMVMVMMMMMMTGWPTLQAIPSQDQEFQLVGGVAICWKQKWIHCDYDDVDDDDDDDDDGQTTTVIVLFLFLAPSNPHQFSALNLFFQHFFMMAERGPVSKLGVREETFA